MAGDLDVDGSISIGGEGNGVFNYVSGGFDVGTTVFVGGDGGNQNDNSPNANGILNIDVAGSDPGGTTLSFDVNQLEVGRHNIGVVNQGGATVTVNGANNLVLSQYANGEGTYNLSAGNLVFGTGANGNMNFNSGTGEFNQTGGTVDLNGNNINMTNNAAANATYNLEDGLLDLGGGNVNPGVGTETFNFTGGTMRDVGTFGFGLTQEDTDSASVLDIGPEDTVGTMTIAGDYNLDGGTVRFDIDTIGTNDVLTVNGAVNFGAGANLLLDVGPDFLGTIGDELTLIVNNDDGDNVSGTFAGLPEGATVTAGIQEFRISYTGLAADGGSNDVVLTYIGSIYDDDYRSPEDSVTTFTNSVLSNDVELTAGATTELINQNDVTFGAITGGGNVSVEMQFQPASLTSPTDEYLFETGGGSGIGFYLGGGTNALYSGTPDSALLVTISEGGNDSALAYDLVADPLNVVPAADPTTEDVHAIATFDTATDTLSLYINGVFVGDNNTNTTNVTTVVRAGNITNWAGGDGAGLGQRGGNNAGGIGNNDQGMADKATDISLFRVYSGTVLSATEAANNFAAAVTRVADVQSTDAANSTWTSVPDGGSVTIITDQGGTVLMNSDGTFTYTSPTTNWNGDDRFQYRTTDGTNTSTVITVDIDVPAINDAPTNLFNNVELDTTPATTQTVVEGATLVFSTANGNAITISDVDQLPDDDGTDTVLNEQLTVTLSVLRGTLNLGTTNNITIVGGAEGTDTISIQGREDFLNTALEGLTYNSVGEFMGADELTITTDDEGNYGADPTLAAAQSFDLADVRTGAGFPTGSVRGDAETVTDPTRGDVLSLNGAGDHVVLDGFKGVTGTDARTMSAWIKTTGDNDAIIMSWGENLAGQKWVFRLNDNAADGTVGALRLEVNGGFQIGSTVLNTIDEWHHVALTWENDGTPDVQDAVLYVDGVAETISGSLDEVVNTGASQDVVIGGETSVGTRDFNGLIDDAAIFTRALTADEIATVFNETNTSGTPGVILSTDFAGRTVSGDTASNITWTTNGVADPGDLTAVDVNSAAPDGAGFDLFGDDVGDSADANNHFAPDLNVDNEGPWSTTFTLEVDPGQIISLDDIVLDYQQFSNGGATNPARPVDYTVTLTGANSGQLFTQTVSTNAANGLATFTPVTPLTLTESELYQVTILADGSGPGNNTGLDGITINGTVTPAPDSILDVPLSLTDTDIIPIEVTPFNDAPIANDDTYSTDEDTAFTATGIDEDLRLWLSADSGVFSDAGTTVATDGQTVQQWNDQLAGGNVDAQNAIQNTAGERPTYVADGINGQPVIRFTAPQRLFGEGGLVLDGGGTAERTVILVTSNVSTNVANEIFDLNRVDDGDGVTNDLFRITPEVGVRNTSGNELFANDPLGASPGILVVTTPVDPLSQDIRAFLNGTELVASGAAGATDTLETGIGGFGIGGSSFVGDIAEVLVFERELNADDLNQIGYDLGQKYGITTSYQPTVKITGDVLDNDTDIDSTPVTPGATLNFDANGLPAGTTTWSGGVAANDWDFSAANSGVSLDVVDSGVDGISQAFQFTGANGASNRGLDNLAGNPSDNSATWEMWIRPEDTGDPNQVIFETGGAGTGMAIWYETATQTVNFTIDYDDGAGSNVQQTVSAVLPNVTDFHQVVAVYGRNVTGGIDQMDLYINGVSADSNNLANLNDWDGSDEAGLGTIDRTGTPRRCSDRSCGSGCW